MFLCTSVVLAVLVGLLRGGKWGNLALYKFKGSWFVIVAILLQVSIFNPWWEKFVKSGNTTNFIYSLSIILLIVFIIRNFNIWGLRLLGAGIALNGITIIANGGYMPSSLNSLKHILPAERIALIESGSSIYNTILITDNTKFKFLCDIFYVPGINVYSVGDILIAMGAFVVIQQIMLRYKDLNIIQ